LEASNGLKHEIGMAGCAHSSPSPNEATARHDKSAGAERRRDAGAAAGSRREDRAGN